MKDFKRRLFALLLLSNMGSALHENDGDVCCRRMCWTKVYCVVVTCMYGCEYVQEHNKCLQGLRLQSDPHVPSVVYFRYKKPMVNGVIE